MAGPSLLKHEKDLKILESELADVRHTTSQKENEYKTQIADLTTQLTEMGKQVHSLTQEMRTNRNGLSSQMKDLMDVMKLQTTSNWQHQAQFSGNSHTPVSSIISPVTPSLQHIPNLQFGNNPLHTTPVHNPQPIFSTISTPLNFPSMSAPPVITHTSAPNSHSMVFIKPPPYTFMPIPDTHPTSSPNPIPQFNQTMPQGNTLNINSLHTPNPYVDLHLPCSPYQTHYKFPKVDFPKFDGTNARGWVIKAEIFFQ